MREILFRGKRTDNDDSEFVYGIPVEGEPLLGMGKRRCSYDSCTICNNEDYVHTR